MMMMMFLFTIVLVAVLAMVVEGLVMVRLAHKAQHSSYPTSIGVVLITGMTMMMPSCYFGPGDMAVKG